MYRRALAVAALAVVGSACSGNTPTVTETRDDGGADGSSTKADASHDAAPSLTNAQACMDRATAQCALIQKCRPVAVETNYGTLAACVSGLQKNCESSLSAKSNGNNATLTEACAKAYPTWKCADFEDNVNTPTACVQKKGTLKSGGSCAFPGQCETGFCAIPPNTQCGVCADPPASGDSCANLTTCGQSLTCAGATETCTTFAANGEACGAGMPCGYQLSCVAANAKKMITGTCQPAVENVGDACDSTQQTGPGCDLAAGLTCNTSSDAGETCQKATIAGTGKPCGTVDDQDALCGAGGTCTAAAGMAGTCIAAAAEGETCDEGNSGTGCVAPQRCIGSEDGSASGTCAYTSADTCD